jgi:hypothetical protein
VYKVVKPSGRTISQACIKQHANSRSDDFKVGHGEWEKIGRLIGGYEVGVALKQGDKSIQEPRLEKVFPVLIYRGVLATR